jgi:hypothetical protein
VIKGKSREAPQAGEGRISQNIREREATLIAKANHPKGQVLQESLDDHMIHESKRGRMNEIVRIITLVTGKMNEKMNENMFLRMTVWAIASRTLETTTIVENNGNKTVNNTTQSNVHANNINLAFNKEIKR